MLFLCKGVHFADYFYEKGIHFKLVRCVLGPSWATPWSQESMGRSALPYDPRGNLRHECLRAALMGAPVTCRPRVDVQPDANAIAWERVGGSGVGGGRVAPKARPGHERR